VKNLLAHRKTRWWRRTRGERIAKCAGSRRGEGAHPRSHVRRNGELLANQEVGLMLKRHVEEYLPAGTSFQAALSEINFATWT